MASLTKVGVLFILLFCIGCTKKENSDVDQIMNADKNFAFPVGFPPEPGQKRKETLLGVDSDHDGVRDDIQRWIYARFPKESEKRAALMQLARVYQESMTVGHNQKELQTHFSRMANGIHCMHERFSNKEASKECEFLRAKALNTKERRIRFLQVDQWLDGMSPGARNIDGGSSCEN